MANYIRYRNAGATRNQELSEDLLKRLAFLEDMGISAEIFSGGQPAKGSGLARVGSTRHDHGNSFDGFFFQGDRKLSWENKEDLPILQEIVRRGKAEGITGWGAGPNYMKPGSFHVGLGSPSVWGSGGKSANAPGWLKDAYYGSTGSSDPIIAEVPEKKPLPSFGALMASKADPIGEVLAAKASASATPDAEPKSRNGPLVEAYNKLAGKNLQVPETIGGIKTDSITGFGKGLGDFAAAMSEQTDSLNKQLAAATQSRGRISDAPVEVKLLGADPIPVPGKKKRKGGLGSLGGYLT